jgi:hypothetical protein
MEKRGWKKGNNQIVKIDRKIGRLHFKTCHHICPEAEAEDEEDPACCNSGFEYIDNETESVNGYPAEKGDKKD